MNKQTCQEEVDEIGNIIKRTDEISNKELWGDEGGYFDFKTPEDAKKCMAWFDSELDRVREETIREATGRIYHHCLVNGEGEDGLFWITYGEVVALLLPTPTYKKQ